MYFRIGDEVEVIAGADGVSRTRGKILRIDRKKNKVVVEGVARVWKHVRRSQKNPQGGRLNKEMPIDASNVMIVDPSTGQPTRIGVRFLADGSKERYAKKSGTSLGAIAPAREQHAKK
ncbi:MAG: 50S ribosomal protein L24 [Planctomycetota bacterium]